jgi:hypothetical protein
VANGSVADNRLALNDLRHEVEVVIGEQDANALADGPRVPTEGDKVTILAYTNPDIASEAEDTFRT